MAIDVQSLFADIIDTPEQRQQKLLQQGMMQGQLLSSGLRGRAAALAPLAQVAGQLGVQRQEDLRRAVQPMIGIDPRTTGEKLAEQLGNIDTSTPQGLMQAAQAIQSIDPVRAATLRQEAVRMRTEMQDRLRQKNREDELDAQRRAKAERDAELFPMQKAAQELELEAAKRRATENQEEREAHNSAVNSLLSTIPETEETEVLRSLIPSMSNEQLIKLQEGTPEDFDETKISEYDPVTDRNVEYVAYVDKNNPSNIVIVAPTGKTFSPSGEEDISKFDPPITAINTLASSLEESDQIKELLSDKGKWYGRTYSNVKLRSQALARSILRAEHRTGRPAEEIIADLPNIDSELLKRGLVTQSTTNNANLNGEWSVVAEPSEG
jgi:hypothetical protein